MHYLHISLYSITMCCTHVPYDVSSHGIYIYTFLSPFNRYTILLFIFFCFHSLSSCFYFCLLFIFIFCLTLSIVVCYFFVYFCLFLSLFLFVCFSLFLFLFVCCFSLFVCLCLFVSVSLCFSLFTISLSVSVCDSVSLFICFCLFLSLLFFLFACFSLSITFSVSLCCLFISLFTFVFLSLQERVVLVKLRRPIF